MVDKQRYQCTSQGCDHSTLLPESPTTGPLKVNKGCPDCGRITTHAAVGRVTRRVRS